MSIKQAIEALETCLAMAEHGDFSTGYCCCGSSVEGHTMGDGHSPVDEGDYHAINAFDKARAALAALRSMPAEPVAQDEEKLLRRMLAIRVAGPTLYGDDGELQDNSVQPFIDFKRDSASEIERKLIERGMANAWKSIGQFDTPHTAPLSDAEKYRECLEWVRGYISRYDPPGLPNHIAQKIDAALAGESQG